MKIKDLLKFQKLSSLFQYRLSFLYYEIHAWSGYNNSGCKTKVSQVHVVIGS